MMFLDESLYGWGVCNIPMPRSSYDIFSDRRKKNGRISLLNRRSRSELPGILTSISGLVSHDVSWYQTITVSAFALFSIIFIFLISRMLPEFIEKEMPEPIEIVIQAIEEPQKVTDIPVPETPKPIIEEKIIDEIIPPKKRVIKVRPLIEKPRFEVNNKPLPDRKPKPVPEETIPEIRIQPRIREKVSKPKATYIPQVTSLEKISKPEDLNISVSASRNEKYDIKDRLPKENGPQLSDRSAAFVSKDPAEQPSVVVVAKAAQKNYRAEVERHNIMVPSDTSEPLLMSTHVPDDAISSARPTAKNYNAHEEKPGLIVPVEMSAPLLTVADVPVTKITPVERTRKNYGAAVEDRDVMMPSETTGSLLPQTDVAVTEVDAINRSQKNYEMDMLDSQKPKRAQLKSISFDNIKTTDIDPSHLISLKELAVCADPEEEFRLKTKLAVLLRDPTRCESNGVLLFFKYPESGYTIRVEIYNPGGVVLEDRCSVLQLAVECINDQKAKGVIP